MKSHVNKTYDDANSEKKQVCTYGCCNGVFLNFIYLLKKLFLEIFSFQKVHKKLSDLVNYIHAVHFHGFDNEAAK